MSVLIGRHPCEDCSHGLAASKHTANLTITGHPICDMNYYDAPVLIRNQTYHHNMTPDKAIDLPSILEGNTQYVAWCW